LPWGKRTKEPIFLLLRIKRLNPKTSAKMSLHQVVKELVVKSRKIAFSVSKILHFETPWCGGSQSHGVLLTGSFPSPNHHLGQRDPIGKNRRGPLACVGISPTPHVTGPNQERAFGMRWHFSNSPCHWLLSWPLRTFKTCGIFNGWDKSPISNRHSWSLEPRFWKKQEGARGAFVLPLSWRAKRSSPD